MHKFASGLPMTWLLRSWVLVLAACAMQVQTAQAQFFPPFGGLGNFVGGVRIDADGVLRTVTQEEQNQGLELLRRQVVAPQGDFAQATDLRMISLKKVQELIRESEQTKKELSQELLYLGGLTRVEYVFVYPERQDIVIAGPSEPWTMGPAGSVVGAKSGRPIVHLEDLLTAFRYVSNARQTGVSVSIDPTEQGVRQLSQVIGKIGANANPSQIVPMLAQAFGPQMVKLEGIPAESHMARVLLAADYRMKLYGMNLAEPPVKGLPSYLDMIRTRSTPSAQLQSRWWMACDYEAVAHSRDRLAWRVSGPGIKTLTEQEAYDSAGNVKQTSKVDVVAKKWADLFTEKLDELATKDTVFGDLRNVMDLCVIAALIKSQNLESLAACDLSIILGDASSTQTPKFDFPSSLDPQISLVQSVQGMLVSASGGVMIESWQVATHTQESELVAEARPRGEWSNSDNWYQ